MPNFLLDELNATTGNVENDKAIKALKANQPDKFLNSITALFNQYGFSAEQIAIILGCKNFTSPRSYGPYKAVAMGKVTKKSCSWRHVY